MTIAYSIVCGYKTLRLRQNPCCSCNKAKERLMSNRRIEMYKLRESEFLIRFLVIDMGEKIRILSNE